MKIAIYTCPAYPDLWEDDQRLLSALSQVGLEGIPQVWDQPLAHPYNAGLLRSTWDYPQRVIDFREFLSRADQPGCPLFNSAAIVRWNLDKHYLLDLAERGIPTVPTHYLPTLSEESLEGAFREFGELVVKPTISVGSYRTVRLKPGEHPHFADPGPEPLGYLVQPYLPEIQDGEWSLYYFAGRYSHTLRKRPKPGDFRVQEHLGGLIEAVEPLPELQEQGEALLAALVQIPVFEQQAPLYVRVDGVLVSSRFLIIEVELIEPAIYFRLAEGAAAQLAQAIRDRLRTVS